MLELQTAHFDTPLWVADMLRPNTEAEAARPLPNFLTVLLEDSVQADIKLSDVEAEARSYAGQSEEGGAPTGYSFYRHGNLKPALLVTPESEEEISVWSRIHADKSLHPLDNNLENIAHRLAVGGIIVVLGSAVKSEIEYRIEQGNKTALQQEKDEIYKAWRAEHEHRVSRQGTGRGGISSSDARVIAKSNWEGFLGGGTPQNPIRVGGVTH